MPEQKEMRRGSGRPPPSGLRGWLSDVYFPALVEGQLDPLAMRLGPHAALDDPLLGRATGMPEIKAHLAKAAGWLRERGAVYERSSLVVGTDRDVAEGSLAIRTEAHTIVLPVAVVAERRRSREVELRLYYATRSVDSGSRPPRAPLVPANELLSLPRMVSDHLGALGRGDLDGILACFETEGALRDAKGLFHRKAGGGMRVFYEQRYGLGQGGSAYRVRGGSADDGRSCAVEFTLARVGDSAIDPRPGLAVYEIGDSGLLRALRLYEEHDR